MPFVFEHVAKASLASPFKKYAYKVKLTRSLPHDFQWNKIDGFLEQRFHNSSQTRQWIRNKLKMLLEITACLLFFLNRELKNFYAVYFTPTSCDWLIDKLILKEEIRPHQTYFNSSLAVLFIYHMFFYLGYPRASYLTSPSSVVRSWWLVNSRKSIQQQPMDFSISFSLFSSLFLLPVVYVTFSPTFS